MVSNLRNFLENTFSTSVHGRIFLVNLFEHVESGHLPSGKIVDALSDFNSSPQLAAADFILDQTQRSCHLIGSYCDLARRRIGASRGRQNPGKPEFCELARIVTKTVEEDFLSATTRAARVDNNVCNPLTQDYKIPSWFTQDHDLLTPIRPGQPCSALGANAATEKLGLLHFWTYGTDLVLLLLAPEELLNNFERPSALDGRHSPGYLARSFGESFARNLSYLRGSKPWIPEWGRTLNLAEMYGYERVRDGGIEVISDLTNREIVDAIVERRDIGATDFTRKDQVFLLELIAKVRAPDEKVKRAVDFFVHI